MWSANYDCWFIFTFLTGDIDGLPKVLLNLLFRAIISFEMVWKLAVRMLESKLNFTERFGIEWF